MKIKSIEKIVEEWGFTVLTIVEMIVVVGGLWWYSIHQ